MDDFVRALRSSTPASPDQPVQAAERRAHGIPLHPKAVHELQELSREFKAPFPEPRAPVPRPR